MFKQFITNVDGSLGYFISSFGIFVVFFILVAILLLMMKKDDVNYMKNLPLTDDQDETRLND